LVGLDEKTQHLMLNTIIGQKLSVREVEAMVKNMKDIHKISPQKIDTPSYDFSEFKTKLSELGYSVKYSKNKLTIEFENEQQIKKLYEKIVNN